MHLGRERAHREFDVFAVELAISIVLRTSTQLAQRAAE